MATANDIITAAFGKIEVSTFTTAQADSALINLNNMVSMLGADGLMYAVSTESFTATVADPEYTIGSGADWDTARPLNVISCYLRDSESYDWPVKVMSGKDYNKHGRQDRANFTFSLNIHRQRSSSIRHLITPIR
jgi:hypothetical protein